ncbi:MAG TPA: hypothetical protein VGA60_09850 [Kiloniellales bacterium]|jgi:hypothetical protein
MMRIIKSAVQAAIFAGIFGVAGAQAASTLNYLSDTSTMISATPVSVDLGEYLQGDIDGTTIGAKFVVRDKIETPFIRVAQAGSEQTAALPVGTIRLRVIPQIGGATVNEPIKWRVTTFGRDSSGARPTVAEVTGSTPELVLPAGWYVVHANMAGSTIKHPVEVTAGRTFKYTLVKN